MRELGIRDVDGLDGGQQPGQPMEGNTALAAVLNVADRSVRKWRHAGGFSPLQADRYAIAIGSHPAKIWPDWWDDAPGEEDLEDFGCRCRARSRRPVGEICDRCGGHLRPSQQLRS
jgi:hypothetical protein